MSTISGQIGIDESGKGDYFGPLVIAGVYVAREQEEQLRAAGVRDSKMLSDKKAAALAEQIRGLCPSLSWRSVRSGITVCTILSRI